jgi:exodeoxyribonuclease V beta subunit
MNEQLEGAWALAPEITSVEASAGTGKTHNITDRILWLVLGEDIAIENILVVTFTEAATSELRDRIRTRLRRALELLTSLWPAPGGSGGSKREDVGDEELRSLLSTLEKGVTIPGMTKRLEAALRDFDQAEISTIHGFCNRTLQRNAFESGVEPGVELVPDLRPLVEEVVTDFWVRRHHDAPLDVIRALQMSGVGLMQLGELARIVVEDPDMPIDIAPPLDAPPTVEAFEQWRAAWRAARDLWRGGREEAVRIVREALDAGRFDGRRVKPTDDEGFGRWVDEVNRFFTVEQEPGADLSKTTRTVFTCDVKPKLWATQPRHPFFDALLSLVEMNGTIGAPVFNEHRQIILDCIEAVRRDVPARKRQLAVQTFSDLLHQLRDALRSDDKGRFLRAALRERYDAALIDEFQDTDPVQWEIFNRVFGDGERRLCLIGDPKQAIYSFRGADFHTYLAAVDTARHHHTLKTNYRSDGGLVRAVNHIFDPARLPGAFLIEGMRYTPVEAHHEESRLHLGRPPFEIRFCRREGADLARNGAIKVGWARTQIVRLVVSDIVDLLEARPRLDRDKSDEPPTLVPRDIAVLVRRNEDARTVQRELRQAGIPSVLRSTESVFLTPVASALALVLDAVLEPSSPAAVKTALSTELIGLRASELCDIEERVSAWDGWSERFRNWQDRWSRDGFMRMFRAVLDDLDLSRRVLGRTGGERRMTDLLHLAELIHSEASRARLGPRGTLSWLRRQIEEPDEDRDTSGLRLESDADAVDVITIHKAKGLQYPVVLCPFLWSGSSGADQELLRYHGLDGVRRLDPTPKTGDTYPPEKQARIASANTEVEAEDRRLLYVALTRAKHRCVVYWGGFNESGGSALAHVLHGDVGMDLKTASDDELLEHLRTIEGASRGAIEVTEQVLARVPPRSYRPAADEEEVDLRSLPWSRSRPLDTKWRRGSFTDLARNRSQDPESGRENDEALTEVYPPLPGEGRVGVPVIRHDPHPDPLPGGEGEDEREITLTLDVLPGGRHTGIFLHSLYEHIDFTWSGDGLREAVEKELAAFGLAPTKLAAPLTSATVDALRAPLDDGIESFRLADVPRADRLSELRFDLPVAGGLEAAGELTRNGLRKSFAAHRSEAVPADYADRVGELGFQPLRGFMTGAIDLVVRRNGRWYLADYKSNHLGDRIADYAPARLQTAMSEGHYFLQYHLYALALHRWLRWRVPGYTYEDRFGGVFYLFLRGMAPRDERTSHGVFFDRPRPEMIAALDDLVAHGEGGGHE